VAEHKNKTGTIILSDSQSLLQMAELLELFRSIC